MAAGAVRLAMLAGMAMAFVAPAYAQKAVGKERVASILQWTPKQQLERYPAIEKVYEVSTIKKGDKVLELPMAATQIDPRVKIGSRTSSLDDLMKANRITGLIAVKDGKVILEKYALGRTADQRWTSFSVAKSVTATLIGAAIKDGNIRSIYDDVTYYLPEFEGTAYDGVTIQQVLTMTSGVKWNEDYTDPKSDVALAGAAPFRGGTSSPLLDYMKTVKREAEPGAKFVYKTGETDLAGFILARSLGGKTVSQYASEKLWQPFGMEQDAIWMEDNAGYERGGCCMSMTLRDYARIGLFMLGGGVANGKQVLPDGWVEKATTDRSPKGTTGNGYGYFWWPREGGYAASGIFGQHIVVYPEENLVIAMNSAMLKATDRKQSQTANAIAAAIVEAAKAN
jgi:CubicO group peptidase (beta-lactamase class C family)